ncbi:MAG: hypothetical protein LIO76_01435, partial [Clostridiales bacterium]|nr:hypothetical protein [Clostridiales bacterium]
FSERRKTPQWRTGPCPNNNKNPQPPFPEAAVPYYCSPKRLQKMIPADLTALHAPEILPPDQ